MADARLITSDTARRARPLQRTTFTLDDLIAGLVARRVFEDEIERLIAILDAADPDPDSEDGGDIEPNGDEHDDNGDREDFSGERPSEDDPLFPRNYDPSRILHAEAPETERVGAWLNERIASRRRAEMCR